jgi:multidrug resistance efflux pump
VAADEPPKPRRKRGWLLVGGLAAGVVVGGAVAGYLVLPRLGLFQTQRPDLLTHTVQIEPLPVTVVERGTLESANNQELVCKVKAGSRGTFASSIKRVIDDGTQVTKGQLVLELDDSALRDLEQTQNIAVSKANAAYIRAKQELEIQRKANTSDITQKTAALEVAEIDLEKFLGVVRNPDLDPLAAVAGGVAGLEEKGEFRMKVDDLSAQLKLAKSDLEAYRDRSAWVERAARSGYQTPSQVGVEIAKFDSARDKVEKLAKEKHALEMYTRKRDLTDLLSKVKVALAGVEQAVLQAYGKEIQAEAELNTTLSVYLQELDKLSEIKEQLAACKMHAPQSGMVVYYKDQNSRFSSGTEGLIQVGAQVKEGQKLLRIPDLTRMQVNTKIHEALVSRIRGEDRRPTGAYEALRAGLLANPHAFSRLLSHSEFALEVARDSVKDREYYVARQGQSALIRVDAFPNRTFTGRVKSVAAVAAQADWNSSDVKLFPTIVSIEDTDVTGLKPDYSAEVTIQVDAGEAKVLTVPLQAVVGTSEMGGARKVYVIENSQPVEREVELGIFNDKKVEVKKGLSEGDVVVLNPKAILGEKARGVREEGDPSGRGAGKAPAGGGGRPGAGAGGGGKPPGAGGGGPQGGGAGGSPKGPAAGAGGKPATPPQ